MAPKLETLIGRYEADLQKILPNFERGFVCPICLRLFDRKSNLSSELAIEHIVPKKLGGKLTTLTCRRCNNTAGTKLESHLVKRVRIEGGKEPISAGAEFCGSKFRGGVHLPNSCNGVMKFFGIRKQSHFQEIDKFGKLLSDGVWEGETFKLDLEPGYVPALTAVALMRSAYLLMFRIFGYRYLFEKSAESIRKTLTEPLVETDVTKVISWRTKVHPPSEVGVSIVTSPKELCSFIVFLTLDRDQDHVSSVALPPPNAGREYFQRLNRTGKRRRCTLSSWLSGDNEEIMPLDEVWHHVIGQAPEELSNR